MSDQLSQEQIDAMMSGSADSGAIAPASELTSFERDTIGELGNISMGSGATTLSMILNKQVNITTPVVSTTTLAELVEEYQSPLVLAEVKYTVGLEHNNVFLLTPQDAIIICDLMMGGDGTNPGTEMGEMQLSAVGEAMNQMMGTAATSMSQFFGRRVDISPPKITHVNIAAEEHIQNAFSGQALCKISFKLIVDGLIESQLIQVLPAASVKNLVEDLVMAADNPDGVAAKVAEAEKKPATEVTSSVPQSAVAPSPIAPSAIAPSPLAAPSGVAPSHVAAPAVAQMAEAPAAMGGMPQAAPVPPGYGAVPPGYAQPPAGYGQAPAGYPPPGYYPPQPGYPQAPSPFSHDPVGVRSAQFAPIAAPTGLEGVSGLDLIMDVALRVTVELGRTRMLIRDVLDLGKGSVVELDKLVGEPVDMLVNGKLIAKGEVVVIDENFGIRVTEIVSPVERFNSLKIT